MSGRSIVFALAASIAVVLVGAALADATIVVVGMVSAMAAGLILAIKTDDTTQPMGQLLFAEESKS